MPRGENLQPGNMKKQLENAQRFREVLELADGGDPEAKLRVLKMRREAEVRRKARPAMQATVLAATRQWLAVGGACPRCVTSSGKPVGHRGRHRSAGAKPGDMIVAKSQVSPHVAPHAHTPPRTHEQPPSSAPQLPRAGDGLWVFGP